jgi:dimethylamine/trimethylamine dehydrogenase
MWNARIVCTQNPTIGEEFRRGWHPEQFSTARNAGQAVLLIGAGPAGLECATVLGKRGFEAVHLVDAAAEVGGCLNWITRIPGRQEWRHVIEYREMQLSKLRNVTTILNTRMTADDVLEYGAQTVIVATGSHYLADAVSPYNRLPLPIDGAFRGNVLTPEQVMSGDVSIGRRVLVWDTDGYFVGPGVAEHLAGLGHEVSAVTPAASFGHYLHYTLEDARTIHDLRTAGVKIYTSAEISKVTDEAAVLDTLAGPR